MRAQRLPNAVRGQWPTGLRGLRVAWTFLLLSNLLVAAHAGTAEPHSQWRELAGLPFALTPAPVKQAGAGRTEIHPDRWQDWHLPAPGLFAITLPEHLDANQSLAAYQSNGSGLLTPLTFLPLPRPGAWTVDVTDHATRLIHLRARTHPVTIEAFYYEPATVRLETRPALPAAGAQERRVRPHRFSLPETYQEAAPGVPLRFSVPAAPAIQLRLRLPFSGVPQSWQDFRVRVDLDGKPLTFIDLRAFQDKRRRWLLDGEPALLSKPVEHILALPEAIGRPAGVLTLTSTHLALARLEPVATAPYLLPGVNQSPIAASARPASHPQAALLSERLQQQSRWADLRALAENNLIAQGVLQAGASSHSTDLEQRIEANRFQDQLFSRYTELLDLLPEGAADRPSFHGRYAEYRPPKLLQPEESHAERWLGAAQLSPATNRAAGAWFISVEPGEPLQFRLPVQNFSGRLRLIGYDARAEETTEGDGSSRHVSAPAAAVRLSLQSDDGAAQVLLLDPERSYPERFDPANTGSWRSDVARIDPAELATAELTVPAGTGRLTLVNHGEHPLQIALQVRVPTRYQLRESDWLERVQEPGEGLLDLWWRAWDQGLDGDGRWQAEQAAAAFSDRELELLNGWMPLFHYLSEQVNAFGPAHRVAPPNLHCETHAAAGSQSSTDVPALAAARQWLQREQWLNANEAIRQALPALSGDACIEAHLQFARNLTELGSHQFAEDYWRTLIRDTRHRGLRTAAGGALGDYYGRQGIDYALVELHAYTLMRWRQPSDLLKLAHALYDAGHDRFGTEVALLHPAHRTDDRLLATLVEQGWLALLQHLSAGDSGPPPRALSLLEQIRNAPVADLEFRDSIIIEDQLFATQRVQILATPNAPLRFQVDGPLRLRLLLRPIATATVEQTPLDWARVTIGTHEYPVPVSLNTQLSRYRVPGANDIVGTATEREYELGPGRHDIVVQAPAWPLAVSLQTRSRWLDQRRETVAVTDPRVQVADAPLPFEIPETAAAGSLPDATPRFELPTSEPAHEQLLTADPEHRGAARQLMDALTFIAATPPFSSAAAARAEWLAHVHAGDRYIAGLRARVRQQTQWQPLESVGGSAGIHVELQDRFRPESEYWRIRNLFLPAWQPGERLLTSGEQVNLALTAPQPARLRFRLAHRSDDNRPMPAIDYRLTMDATEPAVRRLLLDQAVSHELELPAGEHRIHLALGTFASGSFVRLIVEEFIDSRWQPLSSRNVRRYYIADAEQAAEFQVVGPAWLRIDELRDDAVSSRYQYLPAGWRFNGLFGQGDAGSRYRVLQRGPLESVKPYISTLALTPAAIPWPARPSPADLPPPASPSRPGAVPIVRTSAPTYTAALGIGREDDDDGKPGETTRQSSLVRRQRDARLGRYRESALLARQRTAGSSALGIQHRIWRDLEDAPFQVQAEAEIFAQQAGGLDWATEGRLGFWHYMRADARRHSTGVTLLARYLSANGDAPDLDSRVYTTYRDRHRTGLNLSHRVTWQPYRDSEWFAALRLRSNSLSAPGIDHVRAQGGIHAQVGRWQFGSDLQITQYLDDGDRDGSRTVPRLRLQGRWYGRSSPFGRLELRADLRQELNRQRAAATLQLLWHFDRGQGLEDFPGERHWFEPLLREHLPEIETP